MAAAPGTVVSRSKTRRRHPFTEQDSGVLEAIERERLVLDLVKDQADLVIDTSDLNVHQLKERVVSAFSDSDTRRLQVQVESFGYKYGLPRDADIVMDVRFLPNPHWEDALRPLTGRDPTVRDYVLQRDVTSRFLEHFEALLLEVLPGYEAEGRSYLTVAVGCTGGRHRSVAVTEEMLRRLASHGIAARSSHRDISAAG